MADLARFDSSASARGSVTTHGGMQTAISLPGVATLPEENVNQHGQARARGARRGRIEALTSVGNTAASWGAKKFQQTRQRVPFFNWLIRYGVPMTSATIFTLDIVSDGIVTAAFLRQARNFGKFEECTFSRNASYVFAGLSFILIFTPLLLTAVFIARTLMRDYVRRRLSEAQKNVARSDNGAFDGLGQSHGDDSGTLPLRGEQGEWGGGASQTDARSPFDFGHTHAGFGGQTFGIPAGASYLGDPKSDLVSRPRAGYEPPTPQHNLTLFAPELGLPEPHARAAGTTGLHGTQSRSSGGAAPSPRPSAGAEHGSTAPPGARRAGAVGEGREGADAREFGDSPLRRRNGVGGPVGEDRSALRLDQVHADLRSESQMRFSPGAARYAHAASQNLHAAAALDSAMTGGLTGGPEGPISIMQPTHPSHGAIFLAEQRLDPAALAKLRREALVCAIIGFPLLLLVAAGFDLGFVLSSFHPNLTVYLGLENVMPAYNAYRILVEVVLEALPQVILQLLALVLDLSAGCNKQRGKSGASGVQRNIELGGIHIPLNVAIGISMSVALLNLIKTIVILKFESMSVDLSLWEYIKYLMEVGSGQLPLRSIVDNSVGERLEVEINKPGQVRPLLAALRHNKTVKVLQVMRMSDGDVLALLRVLEERQRPYALDIISTAFSDAAYVRVLLALLRSDFPQAVSFRGCKSEAPRWKRQEAYILLSYHLWRDGGQRRFVDDENPVELPGGPAEERAERGTERERADFAQRLLDEWIVQRKICRYDVDRRAADNVSVKLTVPQRQGTLYAALYLLRGAFVIKSVECTYALAPDALAFLLGLSSGAPGRLATLRLQGLRCEFDAQMTECLAEALRRSQNLSRVSLARLWTSGSPGAAVLDALSACTGLTELTLTGNRLGVSGCEALGARLPQWGALNTLKLDACSITDVGAEALARAITGRRISRLQHLAIGGNRVAAPGLAAFATAFAACDMLKTLDISCTPMAAAPAVAPLDPDLPDVLARLDHARFARAKVATGSEGGSGRQGGSGNRGFHRSTTNLSEEAAAAAGADIASLRSNAGGVVGAGGGAVATTLISWSKEQVTALAPLLRTVENVKAHRCVWEYEALKAFVGSVSVNEAARIVGLQVLPPAPAAARQVTVAQALRQLQGRAACGDAAPLLSLSLAGLAPGELDGVFRGDATASLAAKLRSCVVRCPPSSPQHAALAAAPNLARANTMPGSRDFHFLLDMAAHATSLKCLELCAPHACAPSTPAGARALGSFRALEQLRLQRFTLGGSVLQQHVSVRPDHAWAALAVLELRECGLGAREAQHLGALAAYMPKLRELSLADNGLSRVGVEALLRPWTEGALVDTLRLLDLSRNPLGADGGMELAGAYRSLLCLEVLRLEGCALGNRGLAAIAAGIAAAATGGAAGHSRAPAVAAGPCYLIELNLQNNGGRAGAGEALARALAYLPELQKLLYAGNRPGFDGLSALAEALVKCPALQVVTLGDPALTQRVSTDTLDDAELRAAKTVVAVNAVTYISDSEAGGLTFKGCVAFFRKLPFMLGLRELRVQGVGAAVASAALAAQMLGALAAGLRELPGLQVLDVSGIGVWGEHAESLFSALRESPGLELADFTGASLSSRAVAAARAAYLDLPGHLLLDPHVAGGAQVR